MLIRDTPELRTRLVIFADVDAEIGSVVTRITPEQHRAELRRRRAAILRRHPI